MMLSAGCSSLMSGVTNNFAEQLQATVSEHNDPELIKEAIPAYMLFTESMLQSDPENVSVLASSADLYSTYSSAFVNDPERQSKLAQRGFDYAKRALCAMDEDYCGFTKQNFQEFTANLQELDSEDEITVLFSLGAAWGNWVKANSADFNAIADISKITAVMEHIVAIDENYKQGSAHVYLGIIATLIPPSFGGKPEKGREHFERAWSLSHEQNYMVQVVYAQQYARMMFDRELHDRLLHDVLSRPIERNQYSLSNFLAQQQARALLESADDYF
ncbi:MAG: TRAP transporter TatT component family protein [Aestuariibacter sp.]